ncbi:LpxI family protein [Wenxinia marina]|uniref:Phosphatidate cytidylyltransferase n=1 Tax=Wenxinia marina DSM 24838 TaxID=1123501 RepID=A0A0D0P842_9RHOB|nr:UDP-2,3-diacylglucosamine diphosphatase LpxI [Wenxinia marina]KIQ67716.1 hypothetical protein Wenmar_03675 [Wenxinia marina DSM 24838]GGL77722.1 hypothetical protein GCM10011392_35310 [Wenxinia marina]
MIALVAGEGALPAELARRLAERGTPPVICELAGHAPDVPPGLPRVRFRVERMGGTIRRLREMGVDRMCLAGAVRRPKVNPLRLDRATLPLLPRVMRAIRQGDDGALREVIAILEERGIAVVGAHEILPDLLPPPGVPTRAAPGAEAGAAALAGEAAVAEMGARDQGQACVVAGGRVVAREGPDGTDAMLRTLGPEAAGGLLFKAPKPRQERRADLPVIGPGTAEAAALAGLSGVVIEAEGVMVLDLGTTLAALDAAGLFLWVRERLA